MGGERAFLQDHALQPAAIIFEQLGRPEIARNQDRILPQPQLGSGAHLAGHDPQQPIGQILQIMHAVGKQRIIDLPHPLARALLHPLDRGLRSEPAVDRLVDAARPALVIGEHLVGLEHLLVLAAHPELRLAGHAVNLLAHLVEGGVHAVTLGLDILRDGVLDVDAGLVEHRAAHRHAVDQLLPGQPDAGGQLLRAIARGARIDQPGVGDQLAQHHRHRLQRLNLDIRVAAGLHMLHREHPDRALPPDDRHAGEAVEPLLPRLRLVGEIRVTSRLIEVQHLVVLRDRADQPLAERKLGHVHRVRSETAGCEQLQHAFAKKVDRADLAIERLADDLHHLIKLGLRIGARRHHVMQVDQYLSGGGGSR